MRLWRLRGTAESPAPPPGQDPWAVWRHRHGYMKTPAGHRWSSLRDHLEPMEASLGARYDALLEAAWKRWAAVPGGAEVPGPGRVDVDLVVPGPAAFSLSLWGAALEVRLDVVRGSGDWLYDLAAPPRWTLDESEWRRRHLHASDPVFDDLMRRCAAYWATATSHLLLQDLDTKVR